MVFVDNVLENVVWVTYSPLFLPLVVCLCVGTHTGVQVPVEAGRCWVSGHWCDRQL